MASGSEVSIIVSFTSGILTFLSPCILPLFPSYITYITGMSFEEITSSKRPYDIRKVTAAHSLFFILGFSIVFVALGAAVSYFGSFFGIKKHYLEKIGGLLIILLGLHISGALNIGLLNKEKKLSWHKGKIGFMGSLLMGMAFSMGWTPCVGPILASILLYASALESLPRAVVLLSAYSLGLGVPFFLASLAVNQFLFIFNRFRIFMKFIPVITGVFLVIMGSLLFSGQITRIISVFTR